MGTLYKDLCTFMMISCPILFRMRNISDKQMTIRRMLIACWINKATGTLTIFNNYWFSTTTVVIRIASTLRNTSFPCLLLYISENSS